MQMYVYYVHAHVYITHIYLWRLCTQTCQDTRTDKNVYSRWCVVSVTCCNTYCNTCCNTCCNTLERTAELSPTPHLQAYNIYVYTHTTFIGTQYICAHTCVHTQHAQIHTHTHTLTLTHTQITGDRHDSASAHTYTHAPTHIFLIGKMYTHE